MIKVGIIGTGLSANTFHKPAIELCDNFKLTNTLSSKDNMPSDFYSAPFDLAVITSPNFLHYKHARTCLENGKHVLLEKPFTLTLKEAEILYNIAEQKNLTINPYFNRRYDSDFLYLKKELNPKTIKSVKTFESYFDKFIPDIKHTKWKFLDLPGSGLFHDISPHIIDQALFIFGTPRLISAEIRTLKKKSLSNDYFDINMQYDNLIVRLGSNAHNIKLRDRFRVGMTQKSIVTTGLDTYEQNFKKISLMPYFAEEFSQANETQKVNFSPAVYSNFYADLYKKLSKNRFFIEIEDCLNNVKIMNSCVISSTKNKAISYQSI